MDIMKQLKTSELEEHVSMVDGKTCISCDYDEVCPKLMWDNLCWLSDEMGQIGLEIDDPCVEHECISGFLKKAEEG